MFMCASWMFVHVYVFWLDVCSCLYVLAGCLFMCTDWRFDHLYTYTYGQNVILFHLCVDWASATYRGESVAPGGGPAEEHVETDRHHCQCRPLHSLLSNQ